MIIKLLLVGKTASSEIDQMFKEYFKKLNHYCRFSVEYVNIKKKSTVKEIVVKEEGEAILKMIEPSSHLILFDEKGKEFNSIKFSEFIQKKLNQSPKEMIFCIGGAYGFSDSVYQRANDKVALSKMTLTHQMVRVLSIEQIYRAFTILKGEKYHH